MFGWCVNREFIHILVLTRFPPLRKLVSIETKHTDGEGKMTLKIEPTRGSYFKITLNGDTICECMTRPQAQEKFEFLAMVYDAGFEDGVFVYNRDSEDYDYYQRKSRAY